MVISEIEFATLEPSNHLKTKIIRLFEAMPLAGHLNVLWFIWPVLSSSMYSCQERFDGESPLVSDQNSDDLKDSLKKWPFKQGLRQRTANTKWRISGLINCYFKSVPLKGAETWPKSCHYFVNAKECPISDLLSSATFHEQKEDRV